MFSKLFSYVTGGNMTVFLVFSAILVIGTILFMQNMQLDRYKVKVETLQAENIKAVAAYVQVLKNSEQLAKLRKVDSATILALQIKLTKNAGELNGNREKQDKLEVDQPIVHDYLASPVAGELARLLDAEDGRISTGL